MDLRAECGLGTAPSTGLPPNQDLDYAEEFALCASVWSDLRFYDYPDGAQALPSATSSLAAWFRRTRSRHQPNEAQADNPDRHVGPRTLDKKEE